jgi:hypothetical protein
MPHFFALSKTIHGTLIDYFSDKPVGTKLNYGVNLTDVDPDFVSGSYLLKNSYIKLTKDIYALGRGREAILGSGTSGKVKFIQALSSSSVYVVKILRQRAHDRNLFNPMAHERAVLEDLGLYRDSGSRQNTYNKKHYMVMIAAGMTLGDYITSHPYLPTAVRFDLAIQLCWRVHELHDGLASQTNTRYAHCDLKPENIAVDSSGRVRLIDLGSATNKPDESPNHVVGTPAYLPDMQTMADSKIRMTTLDVLALKRVVYMPNKVLCFLGYIEDRSGHHFGFPMLFPQALLLEKCLTQYFDTAAKKLKTGAFKSLNYDGNPLILASLLVLARYGLLDQWAKAIQGPFLAYFILGAYFSRKGADDTLVAAELTLHIKAYLKQRVTAPRVNALRKVTHLALLMASGITKNLHQALENERLLDLVKEESPWPIRRAASLLWQNGFSAEYQLAQLQGNELRAQALIRFFYSGDLERVKSELEPEVTKDVVPSLVKEPLIFPSLKNATTKKEKPQYLLDNNKDHQVGRTSNQSFTKLPALAIRPLFFFPPEKDKGTTRGSHFLLPALNS